MPASSASLAARLLLAHEASHRSGAVVMHNPLEQFIANRPSLNLLDAKSPVCGRAIIFSLMCAQRSLLQFLLLIDSHKD
jgi:hypothetical protein